MSDFYVSQLEWEIERLDEKFQSLTSISSQLKELPPPKDSKERYARLKKLTDSFDELKILEVYGWFNKVYHNLKDIDNRIIGVEELAIASTQKWIFDDLNRYARAYGMAPADVKINREAVSCAGDIILSQGLCSEEDHAYLRMLGQTMEDAYNTGNLDTLRKTVDFVKESVQEKYGINDPNEVFLTFGMMDRMQITQIHKLMYTTGQAGYAAKGWLEILRSEISEKQAK